ncbi:hypothetical protein AGMMS49965_10330 [Bacteroidia bacterium]|nr:hypothetical protein AGMMS49965_10330 [Bacteroidia bacterium]
MKDKKLQLINENSSPLFRIMSVYNSNTANRVFTNNICAFYIGNGIVVSVAHNLRLLDILPCILSESFYQSELLPKINVADKPLFDRSYQLIGTNQRIAMGLNQTHSEELAKKLDESKVDRRYTKLYSENCCSPFLVATFRNNVFCNDTTLSTYFPVNKSFPEPTLNRHTFLIELELLDNLVSEDIAIYRIINTPEEIINKLPAIEIDFELYDTGTQDYFCLQVAPYDNLGRIINEARIEGLLDNFATENDLLGNSYHFEGMRYLIKGYFRFGSSGAPYLIYDHENETFKVNAIQSQASFIQLSINGNKNGNLQYVNGIATPLSIVEQKIRERQNEVV